MHLRGADKVSSMARVVSTSNGNGTDLEVSGEYDALEGEALEDETLTDDEPR